MAFFCSIRPFTCFSERLSRHFSSGITKKEVRKDFEYYRSEYFINPKESVRASHIGLISMMAQKLLGIPSIENTQQAPDTNVGMVGFAHHFVHQMQKSRKFDHLSVAQIHPDGNLPAILAHISSTLRNNNTIVGEVSPNETQMERESVTWLLDHIARFDGSRASGAIVSGGTLANLTGLLVARERLLLKGWDGKSPVFILTTHMAHYSIKKAAFILGTKGIVQVLNVPMEENTYKMSIVALEHMVDTCKKMNQHVLAIVGVAGETETGLVDDLQQIAEIADSANIHLHVDGAYGAPYVLSKKKKLFYGMERADSLSVDGHKYLYTPYSAGSILFKRSEDHALLEIANLDGDEYMFKSGQDRDSVHAMYQERMVHLGKRRIEGSMGGQGAASIWAVTKTLGTEGLEKVLDHNIEVAEAVYRAILSSKVFKAAHAPEMNTLCFYPVDSCIADILQYPEEQARLVELASAVLEQKTRAYLSSTSIEVPVKRNGNRIRMKVFRFVATHPYTEIEDALKVINDLHKVWDELVYYEQAINQRKNRNTPRQ